MTGSTFLRISATAIATVFLLGSQLFGQQNLSRKGYDKASTLKEATEILHAQLLLDNKPEFAALVTEDRIREAIGTMIQSFDALLNSTDDPKLAKSREDWTRTIRAACLKMAVEGHWPAGSSFNGFYLLKQDGVNYQGLAIRLNVVTADARFNALPVIDVWFGRSSRK